MGASADVAMIWGVCLLVTASVAWLALHGWRQGRVLRRWARERGLAHRPRDDGNVDAELEAFRRDDAHLRRRLDQVREVVVVAPGIRLFRFREIVDLTPWTSGTGPPKTRVAVVFDAADGSETYSVFDREGSPTSDRPPGLRFSDPGVCRSVAAKMPPSPPHPVSVSLSEGRGLAYLLSPSGNVSPDGLEYLARLARRLTPSNERGPPAEADDRSSGPVDEASGAGAARGESGRRLTGAA